MAQGKRLVDAMLKAGQQRPSEMVDMVMGKVTSIKPLKVKLDKIELTESFLIVGALCTETIIKTSEQGATPYELTIPAHSTETASEHTHKVAAAKVSYTPPDLMLWRGLKVGDEVYMIKMAKGQKYYIMQRKEGITDAS